MSQPIEIGTDEQFAAVRAFLEKHSYTEETLCKRFGIKKLSEFEDVPDREQVEPWDKDSTGVLLRLFIETRFVPETFVREKLGDAETDLLEDLGLIHGNADNLEEVWSPVSVVPFVGLWSVCDSWHRPDRAVLAPKDPVYAPIVSNAHQFFRLLPKSPCDRLLELCSEPHLPPSTARGITRRKRMPSTSRREARISPSSIAGSTTSRMR